MDDLLVGNTEGAKADKEKIRQWFDLDDLRNLSEYMGCE